MQEKTREELEAEIVPRYSRAVLHGLKVLDDAFITVEIKPNTEGNFTSLLNFVFSCSFCKLFYVDKDFASRRGPQT